MGAEQSQCETWIVVNATEDNSYLSSFYRDNLSSAMVTVVMPILFFVGLAGNLAFLFVMARVSWMHTVTNYYLANLAFADISFLFASIGEKMWSYLENPVIIDEAAFIGRSGCIVINLVKLLSFYASLFLVTLVSLERFYAICKPVQHWMLSDKGRTVKLVGVAWLLALVFAGILIPANSALEVFCFSWPDVDEYKNYPIMIGECLPSSDLVLSLSLGMQTVPFVIAMLGNISLYVMIIKNLNQRVAAKEKKQACRQGSASNNPPPPQTQSHQIRNTVARMLIVNGTLFFLCLAPFQLISFAQLIALHVPRGPIATRDQMKIIRVISQTTTYLNSVVNPFVYTVTNKRYRHAFYVAFTFSRTDQRRRYSKNTSVVTTDMSTRM